MQTTSKVLMVRPVRFAFNEETASNNAFQVKTESDSEAQKIQQQAVTEFDNYVKLLRDNGVEVEVLQDTEEPFTPDSIFPNNCFSTHIEKNPLTKEDERTLVLYPMFAPNRRKERTKLLKVLGKMNFQKIIDLTGNEKEEKFLEGTGSLILDREHKIAFACESPRTNEEVLEKWASKTDYDYFLFNAEDENGTPIYHTNVMMHVGTRFAVVCLDSVTDINERERLIELLEENDKEIVEITFDQMHQFAGNMLELHAAAPANPAGRKLLIMSATAKRSLTPEQIALLEEDVKIVAPELTSIETAGGGSARCMIAELY
ncbi:MAG: amidinotransferase [Bacteroidales bacterium]|nr:amidinotransferase [Bacteroidales bacterium]